MRDMKRRIKRMEKTTLSESNGGPAVFVPPMLKEETSEVYLSRYRDAVAPKNAICILPDNGR